MNGNILCLWREEGLALPVVRAVPGKAGNDEQRGLWWLGSSVLRPDQSRIPPSADITSNGNRSGGRLTYGALKDTARKSSLPTAALLLSQPELQSLAGDGAPATLLS